MLKFSTFLLLATRVGGSVISLRTKNFLIIWLGLEINLFSILGFFLLNSKFNIFKSCFYYFFVKMLGSLIILVGGLLFIKEWVFVFGLLLKVGFIPFFFWVLPVIQKFSWLNIFILLTLQKFPLINLIKIVFRVKTKILLIWMLVLALIRRIGIFNKLYSLKAIVGFSSLTRKGLIMYLSSISLFWGEIFFVFYIRLQSLVCLVLNKSLNSVYSLFSKSATNILSYTLVIILLLGLPPFIGFFNKVFFVRSLETFKKFFLCVCVFFVFYINSFVYIWTIYIFINSSIKNFDSLFYKFKEMLILYIMFLARMNLIFLLL